MVLAVALGREAAPVTVLALRYLIVVGPSVVLCALVGHQKHLVAAIFQVDDARLQAEGLHCSHGALALGLTLREHRLHHSIAAALVVFNGWVSGGRIAPACRV